MTLLDEAVEAHGGRERFEAIEALRIRLRTGGVALPSRGQPRALSNLDAEVRLHEPHVRFRNWPEPGQSGVFDGWETTVGSETRSHRPRSGHWRWDIHDVMHFAGYALWNYVTAPFLLSSPGFRVEERPGRRLAVTFPAEVPTHSARQTLYLDDQGRIARLDYTAEVFGSWARAAHFCRAYETYAGLLVPVRRRVVPRAFRRGLPGPTLVSIEIDSVEELSRAGG